MFLSFMFLLKFISWESPSYDILSIFYKYNSPINLIASVSFFLFFIKVNIFSNKYALWIRFFAPLTFGVYLIHDNIFVREHLWHQWLQTPVYYNSPFYAIHWGISVITVFLICALIEWGRRKFTDLLIALIRRLCN